MTADLQPYPAMKDSGVEWLGKVPAHWYVCRVKAIASLLSGGTPSSTNRAYWGGDIVWLTPQDLGAFKECLVGASARGITKEGYDSCGATLAPAGSVAISTRAPIGYVGILSIAACTNQGCRLLVPTGAVRSDYLYYSLKVARVTLESLGQGTTFPELSRAALAAFSVSLPPFPEQAAIVCFLDHADRRIRRYIRAKQKLIALLEESRTALITHAVNRGLDQNAGTHSTRSHVFPLVPDGWNLWRIRSLIRRVRRPVVVRPETEYREIGIRSWGKGIFHKDPVRGAMLGEKSVFRIEPGDFVLNIVFAWEGAVSVVSENETGMIASHRFPTFRPSPDVDLDYLLMVFQSEQGRRLMELNAPGAAGRNKTLRVGQFLDEEVPLPTVDVQKAIVSAVRDEERRLADLAAKSRQTVRHLKELRTATIAVAVTGKLDVRAAAAGLPEVDPLTAEGDSVDGVDHEAGSERMDWRQAVEEGGPLAGVVDA